MTSRLRIFLLAVIVLLAGTSVLNRHHYLEATAKLEAADKEVARLKGNFTSMGEDLNRRTVEAGQLRQEVLVLTTPAVKEALRIWGHFRGLCEAGPLVSEDYGPCGWALEPAARDGVPHSIKLLVMGAAESYIRGGWDYVTERCGRLKASERPGICQEAAKKRS